MAGRRRRPPAGPRGAGDPAGVRRQARAGRGVADGVQLRRPATAGVSAAPRPGVAAAGQRVAHRGRRRPAAAVSRRCSTARCSGRPRWRRSACRTCGCSSAATRWRLHRRLVRSGLPFGTCLDAVYLHPCGTDEFKPILGGRMHTQYPGRPDQAVLHLPQPRLPAVAAGPAQAAAAGVGAVRLVLPGVPPRPHAGLPEWIRLRRHGHGANRFEQGPQ